MTNAHDAHKLLKLASSLAKFVDDSEKISLPFFTSKLLEAHRQYPEDHTIGTLSTIMKKMANSDKLLISRAEIRDLYNKFYSRNTKFAQVFAEELGQTDTIPAPKAAPSKSSVDDLMQEALDKTIDPILASSLDQIFGGKGKAYKSSAAKQATSVCTYKFNDLGFRVKAEVACGQGNVLVCSVAFETPRGTTSILVPVETDGEQIYEPSVFIGNSGSEEINKDTVVAYLTSSSGNKLLVKAEEVLQAALIAKGSDTEISDVDLALTKLNAQKESLNSCIGEQIVGIKVEKHNPNLILDLPKIEDPQMETIAKTFDSELGFASFKFGSKVVEKGYSLIKSQLDNCGISASNIAVASCSDDSVMYSVALNGGTVAFKVPVKVENNNVLPPGILLCNGTIKSFDKSVISSLLHEEGFDRVAALSASPLYGVKPSELVNVVRTAVAEENYAKAEDALNILSVSEDEKAYNIALAAFNQGLKKEAHVEVETTKCSMIVRNAHSQHDICGHTGLPIHKIYQDKYGNCLPKYRQGMSDSYEGATFMNHKIYL